MVHEDGSVTWIYCHYDGDEVGPTLVHSYAARDQVAALLALGDRSSLGPRIEPRLLGGPSPTREAEQRACRSVGIGHYVRAARRAGAEFIYLFDKDEWGLLLPWSSGSAILVTLQTARCFEIPVTAPVTRLTA